VVVGNLFLGQPVGNLILVVFLDISHKCPKIAVVAVDTRTASLLATFVRVLISR
jgi:hypothetical protein